MKKSALMLCLCAAGAVAADGARLAGQFQERQEQAKTPYGNHHSFRVVPTDGRPQLPQTVKLWNGSSRAHLGGNTWVINIDNQNDQGWIQIVGGFHSDEFKIVEHWTRESDTHLVNVMDILDPRVYTQTWKMRIDYRINQNMDDEDWENADWEGNKLGGLRQEFWGEAKMDKK